MTRAALASTLVLAVLTPAGRALCAGGVALEAGCAAHVQRAVPRTVEVRAGDDLQRALDEARPGDTLSLQAGATFVGPFTLPVKEGAGFIVVRTSELGRLPPEGARVGPEHARFMPALEAFAVPVFRAAPGAHHFRLIGLEVRPVRGSFVNDLIQLGGDHVRRARDVPAYFAIDRCYLHGDPELGARRGLALNSRHTEVLGSYFADFKEAGADSQAIAGWNGPGPFRIVGNYLEAAGENLMFGGADPAIAKLVPSDIEIRGNHFRKPLAWKRAGSRWTVKNLLELKNARRVRIEGNVLENHWVGAQNGFAVLLTVRNQDGGAPWSVVEDVSFTHNVVRHVSSGISVLAHDDRFPSARAARIRIADNLFEDVGGAAYGGGGTLLQLIGGASDVVIEHNTAFHTGNVIMAEGEPHAGFVFADNIVQHNEYGIIGTGSGPGQPTLARYFPGAVVKGNAIVGGAEDAYPASNFFPAKLADVGFVPAAAWPRLAAASRYHAAARDGRDLGADVDALERMARVVASPPVQPRADAR